MTIILSDKRLGLVFIGAVFFLPLALEVAVALLLLVFFGWLIRTIWTGRLEIRRTNLDLPLLGFFLLSAVSITQAPQWYESWYNWSYLFGRYVLIYFLTVHVLQPGLPYRQLLYAMLGAAVIVSLYGIFQYVTGIDTSGNRWVDNVQFPWLKTRAFSTLGNPNILAGYLVMCVGLASGILFAPLKTKARVAVAAAISVFLVCIAVTFSRGAWVALGVMGVSAAMLRGRRAVVWCLVVLLVAVSAVAFVQADAMERLRSIANPSDSSSYLRFLLWESTWDMIVVKPWLGWGWASFPTICPDYNTYVREENSTIYHAHNTFLHYASEIGIPGMLFFAWAWIRMMVNFFQSRALMIGEGDGIFAGAAFKALVGLLAYCMADHIIFNTQVGMIFWMFLGCAGRMGEQTSSSYWVKKKFGGLAGIFSQGSN